MNNQQAGYLSHRQYYHQEGELSSKSSDSPFRRRGVIWNQRLADGENVVSPFFRNLLTGWPNFCQNALGEP